MARAMEISRLFPQSLVYEFLGKIKDQSDTVDGRNPANQLRLVVHPITYKVLYIPGRAGFIPSTVSCISYIPEDVIT